MFKELANKTYLVGGAIRNELLGLEAKDLDYVIEKTTEEEFRKVFPENEVQKVGNNFPVFLIEGNEVALARTEKSTGNGYTDFEIVAGTSIEEDLGRRDITINSIAIHYETNIIKDPFNGIQDLKDKIIRTINKNAFEEDPLRIYRALRFATEFEFKIEKDTIELMKKSIHLLKEIPTERVALELEKMYTRSKTPSIFFQWLNFIDGLKIHFKPLYLQTKVPAGSLIHHPKTKEVEFVYHEKTNSYELKTQYINNL